MQRAIDYAEFAVQSEKVPRYVKLQAAAWLRIYDGEEDYAYIDFRIANVVDKLLKVIRHPDLNQPLFESIEDYAYFLLMAIFTTKNTADDSFYYQTVLLEIARKNYKTFNAAVIIIILMLIGPQFGRFFSVAPDYQLSNELRLAMRKIIKSSPVIENYFVVKRDMIECKMNYSEYKPLAYSNDRLDGKTAFAFLADEIGAMDDYPIEAMRSSQVSMNNKMGILLSTQYPNDSNGLITEVDAAKRLLDALGTDEEKGIIRRRIFALLYEPDKELINDWQNNDNVLYHANPVAVNSDTHFKNLLEAREVAVRYEEKRENFLCKHCNIQYKGVGSESYVDLLDVKECIRDVPAEFWRGRPVFVGVDLSMSSDNTAVAMVARDDDGRPVAKVWGFIPGDRIEEKSNKENLNYKRMIRQGYCFESGERIIDYVMIENFIKRLPEEYGVRIVNLGYDPWHATASMQRLSADGLQCTMVTQHSRVLCEPTKYLAEEIQEHRCILDRNLFLEVNFANAKTKTDNNMNKSVHKKSSHNKVDLVVALINAIYLMLQDEQNHPAMIFQEC